MKISKTKLAGFGFILGGIAGLMTGQTSVTEAIQAILTGLGIVGVRDALSKIGK